MPATSFAGLAIVALVGFAVPLVLGFVPALRLPSVVLEIVVGILIGPSVLHWVTVDQPIAIVSIILVATSLGIVIPLLKDAGEISSDFGQLTIAGASIADFGAIILLSLFFSRQATG